MLELIFNVAKEMMRSYILRKKEIREGKKERKRETQRETSTHGSLSQNHQAHHKIHRPFQMGMGLETL